MHIVGRRTEAANCVELAGFAGPVILAELSEIAVRFTELVGFAVAGAAGCVGLAEFAGAESAGLAELVAFAARLVELESL